MLVFPPFLQLQTIDGTKCYCCLSVNTIVDQEYLTIRNNDKYNIDMVNQGIRRQYHPPQPLPPPNKKPKLKAK